MIAGETSRDGAPRGGGGSASARFEPPPLLGGPHVQTLLGKALRPRPDLPLVAQRLELPDGDFVDLVRSRACDETDRPIVLVLHGLEGSARRRYMLVTYEALTRHGLAPVGLSFRGCSGVPNRVPRAYHSGDTDDVSWVLGRLSTRYPGRVRGIVGFSLGGNVVLKHLGELGGRPTGLGAAAVVSVPFDLAAGARELERPGTHWIYRRYFLRSLQRKVAEKRALIGALADVDGALRARTLREFDDALTAPLHGFSSAAEYYRICSSARYIDAVRTPTLVIHAMDDPFLPARHVPLEALSRNPFLTPLLTPVGGHVGFVSVDGTRGRFWAEEQVARYLAAALLADAATNPAAPAGLTSPG